MSHADFNRNDCKSLATLSTLHSPLSTLHSQLLSRPMRGFVMLGILTVGCAALPTVMHISSLRD
ncbi:MAG: hypothetical protein LBE12_16945 [Planctomycetaceae bacterium]|nr:hypothetical protein [Planctomycetaceae bacterium]